MKTVKFLLDGCLYSRVITIARLEAAKVECYKNRLAGKTNYYHKVGNKNCNRQVCCFTLSWC